MAEAPEIAQPHIGLLRILRCMAQSDDPEKPSEASILWSITGANVSLGDEEAEHPGLVADLWVVTDDAFQIGVSGVVSLVGYPAPADEASYSDDELDTLLHSHHQHVQHTLWDALSTVARGQAAIVAADMKLPLLTPKPTLIFRNDDELPG